MHVASVLTPPAVQTSSASQAFSQTVRFVQTALHDGSKVQC